MADTSAEKSLRDRMAEYRTKIPEVLTETGFAHTFENDAWIVRHPTCEKCETRVSLGTSWRGYSDSVPILRVDRHTGQKAFSELKAGGFNWKLLVEFLRGEVEEEHARHLRRDAADNRLSVASQALFRAVKDLGLPDLFERNWRNEITEQYGKLARAHDDGTVHFRFKAEPGEVESVLRFLSEQGILGREAGQ